MDRESLMGMLGGNASVVASDVGSTPNPAMGPTPPTKAGCVKDKYESSSAPELDYAMTFFYAYWGHFEMLATTQRNSILF